VSDQFSTVNGWVSQYTTGAVSPKFMPVSVARSFARSTEAVNTMTCLFLSPVVATASGWLDIVLFDCPSDVYAVAPALSTIARAVAPIRVHVAINSSTSVA
jgi:hypothetical protein